MHTQMYIITVIQAGLAFQYAHGQFKFPMKLANEEFNGCWAVVSGLNHVNWYVGTPAGNRGLSKYSHSHVIGTMYIWYLLSQNKSGGLQALT